MFVWWKSLPKDTHENLQQESCLILVNYIYFQGNLASLMLNQLIIFPFHLLIFRFPKPPAFHLDFIYFNTYM